MLFTAGEFSYFYQRPVSDSYNHAASTLLFSYLCKKSGMQTRLILFLLLLAAGARNLNSQVVINEVQPANTATIADEDGDYEDWIELYNAGNVQVDLDGYGLSDDTTEPYQWTFPPVSVEPGGYLFLFASGKNRKKACDHWEMAVDAHAYWRYFVGTSEPPADWKDIGFDASSWLYGKGGIGYGDGDDSTVVEPCMSVYMRQTFTVTDTSRLCRCLLSMDYDDGFVAYLNGVEIARSNVDGYPPPYNQPTNSDHEALMYQGGLPEDFEVPWALFKSLMIPGTNVLAIQTHNISMSSTDLSSIPFLFFGMTDNAVQFQSPPGWFSMPAGSTLHTSFKLEISGEILILTCPDGTVADLKTFSYTAPDHSLCRIPDGSNGWCVTDQPSPYTTNNGSTCMQGYSAKPVISPPPGFYSGDVTVEITGPLAGSEIHYTLDGNIPRLADPVYTAPIILQGTTVVRAKAFGPTGYFPGLTATSTYIVNDSLTIPVISISTDSVNLWDTITGIYIHYWEEWERECHVEYFSPMGSREFDLDGLIKIHGGWTRTLPQKSFTIKTSPLMDSSFMQYGIFDDKPIFEFKNLVLSNSGNDWMNTHFRDALMQKAMQDTWVDYAEYKPSAVFLNNEYWGIYNIRELNNRDFVEDNHGVDADSIDMIEMDGTAVFGTSDSFWEMVHFILTNNMGLTHNYEAVKQMWDLENYTDYFISNIYFVNNDWIGDWTNNIKLWRDRRPGGKWHYILWDMDFGLGLASSYSENKLAEAMDPPTASVHAAVFKQLLTNPYYRDDFITRHADLVNTIFQPVNITPLNSNNLVYLASQMKSGIEKEMPRAWQRWIGGNVGDWYNNMNWMLEFMMKRPPYAREDIVEVFGFEGMVDLCLEVSPPQAGKIKINTVIPGYYPWQGIYYMGVPVTLTAIANPGYVFDHWQSNTYLQNNDTSRYISFNPTVSDTFKAVFNGSYQPPKITFSEVNYHSNDTRDAGDWIELHNYGSVALDLSDCCLQGRKIYHRYTFPTGLLLPAGGFLVLAEDTSLFHSQFPGVEVLSQLGFGFDNGTQSISLYNESGVQLLDFTYHDTVPRLKCADGLGRTLELKAGGLDLNDPDSWRCGCPGGTPGGPGMNCSETIFISEINYHPADWADAGDWLELHNSSPVAVDISGWKFSDDNDDNIFEISPQTILQPKGYLVLISDEEKFTGQFPWVTNKTGPFPFGLGNAGETLRLFDNTGRLYFPMIYDDDAPWPPEPDGDGFTLELLDENGDFCNGENWFAGCPGGSPGEAYFEPCTTGLAGMELDESVRIFPNPSSGQINLDIGNAEEKGCILEIFDAFGASVLTQALRTEAGSPRLQVTLPSLPPGLYIVRITADGARVLTRKVVITR
jgi:hypothetical protein